MTIDWTNIQKKYRGLWIALADDEKTVVASGKSAKEVLQIAKDKGHAEPIITRMPLEITAYVGQT